MGQNAVVRKATLDDIRPLVALMRDFYAESNFVLDERQATASFSTLLSQPSLGSVWIAFQGERAVGHAVLTIRYTMEHGGLSGCIDDVFVDRAYRAARCCLAIAPPA